MQDLLNKIIFCINQSFASNDHCEENTLIEYWIIMKIVGSSEKTNANTIVLEVVIEELET